MAMADLHANTEGEGTNEPAPAPEVASDLAPGPAADDRPEAEAETGGEPTLGWHESVATRPIGLGPGAEVVVLDRGVRGAPAMLLVVAGGGRSARVYRPGEEGEPAFPRVFDAGTAVEGLDGLRCLCPLPDPGSGRVDLVGLGPEGLVLVRGEGASASPGYGPREPLGLLADLGLGSARVAQMAAVDWDGDGRVDLLVGLDDLDGYWPDSPALPVDQQVGFNQQGGHPGYDRGGRWRGRAPEGRIGWLKNVGEPGRPRFDPLAEIRSEAGRLELAEHPAPLAVSWYGGDNLELMLGDSRGGVQVFRNFGGQRPAVLMEPRTLKGGGHPLLLPEDRTALVAADLDGDGRTELLSGLADGRVVAYRATSRDGASGPHVLMQEPGPLWLGGDAVVSAADLDGDGGLDLVFGDGPGHLYWMRDLGRGPEHRYAPPARIEAGGGPFRLDPGPDGRLGGPIAPRLGHACPALVDWTGNGRPDLLVGGSGGEVVLLRNDGSSSDPRFAAPVGLRCEATPLILPPRVRPALADWRGTGGLDLLALDLQGFLCLYPKADDKGVDAPIPLVDRLGRVIRLDGGFGLGGHCSLWAGPWTDPGRVDLLVGLPAASARFVLPALTGRPLADPASASTVILLENQGRLGLVARPIFRADGSPLVVGRFGCSPSGFGPAGAGLDLLVGSDDGHVHLFRRADLRW